MLVINICHCVVVLVEANYLSDCSLIDPTTGWTQKSLLEAGGIEPVIWFGNATISMLLDKLRNFNNDLMSPIDFGNDPIKAFQKNQYVPGCSCHWSMKENLW